MRLGEKNPNYLGSWDLLDKSEVTLTIKKFGEEEIVSNGKKECCAIMYFAEDVKPMVLNVTNRKMLARLFKSTDSKNMVGKKVRIHTEKVKAFGAIHDALRIMDTLPKEEAPIKCEGCGMNISPAHGMTASELARYTKEKYKKALCAECAKKEKEKELTNEADKK